MRHAVRITEWTAAGLLTLALLGGCPGSTGLDYVPGGTGDASLIQSTASVNVLTPVSPLSIRGGTQVEVNWQATARTRSATLDILVDPDLTPGNGNEIVAYSGLPLTETRRLVDTTSLARGTYYLGVVLREVGQVAAVDYAPGTITIDQLVALTFQSPRDNLVFDRSARINPRIDVAWTLFDPDSINTVEIYLDPDSAANGNEVLLYRSTNQSGDQFSFDLPSAAFAPGTYRILALVSDGLNPAVPFYMPGTIRLRARLAGPVDLRDLDNPNAQLAGAVFEGFNPRDNAGSFVGSGGDFDGDGFSDFMIMAQFGKPGYQTNIDRTGIGEAYFIYGRQKRFAGLNNLNSTGTLFRGDIFLGVPEVGDPIRPSRGITSFDVLDDWDGDGVRELAFGLPFVDSRAFEGLVWDNDGCFRTGAVVIASGACLTPALAFPGGHVYSLAGFGHQPRGTRADTACCELFYVPNSPGGCNVMIMHNGEGPAELDVVGAQPGCRIFTNDYGDQCGETINRYPSNGLIISVPNRDPAVNTFVGRSLPGAGVVSLYFGSYIWDLANTALPHNGPHRYVLDDQRLFPSGAGFLPGSPGYFVDDDDTKDAEPCSVWRSLNPPVPERTVRFYGGFAGARVGHARTLGDFNADGVQDIVLGGPLSNGGAGATYIVFGRIPALYVSHELNLEELGLPMNSSDPFGARIFDGVRVIGGPGERLGESQDNAGDFNNDGIPDIVLGSALLNNRRGGATVFFGSRDVINLTQRELLVHDIAPRGLGVTFVGEEEGDMAGARVAGVGDVDGDGNDDIAIAAPHRSVRLDLNQDGYYEIDRTNCGVVYVVYGSPNLRGTFSLADIGTAALPGIVFIGRNSDDELGGSVGEQGDRTSSMAAAGDVDGDGFTDLLLGSPVASPRNRARAGEVYLINGRGE